MKIQVTSEMAHDVHTKIMEGLSRTPQAPPPDSGDAPRPGGGRKARAGLTVKVANSLRSGVIDEGLSPRDPDVQALARSAWRCEPPTLWMLALYRAQGDAFPFREALERHFLEEQEDGHPESKILLDSPLVRTLAGVISGAGAAVDALRRLRERFLAWEEETHRAWMPLPSAAQTGADADDALPLIASTEVLAGDLEVTLTTEEELVLVAVQPSAKAGAPLHVQLLGQSGKSSASHAVEFEPVGEYAGARVHLGLLADSQQELGAECVMLVSKRPVPDLSL